LDFYRFSISWSRILPTGELSSKNQLGIDYYNRLINMLLEHGVEPLVTIYHWDLPSTIQAQGGWESAVVVDYFKTFADVVFEEFGDRVKNWITLNEVAVYCINGYGNGGMAPLLNHAGTGEYLCAHHSLLAHAEAFHLYKEKYFDRFHGRVGITLNSDFYISRDGDNADSIRDQAMQFSLGWYMHPLTKGNYPQIMIDNIARFSAAEGLPQSRLPVFTPAQVERVKGTTEFMGLNYYTSRLAHIPSEPSPDPSWSRDTGLEFTVNAYWDRAESAWLYSVPDGLRGLLK
jgi:beta-glucosidase/6-phospho-beta-glucosidase/beta-galactosidase